MSNCVLVLLPVETHGEFQVGPPQAKESRPAPPCFQTLSSPNLLYLDTTAGTNRVSLIPTIGPYLRSFPSQQK